MTTTLDPATLPCPEGWRWERHSADDAVLYRPGTGYGQWVASMSRRPDGAWIVRVDRDGYTLASVHPTLTGAAESALDALDAAAAGEAPSGPTREQVEAMLDRLTMHPDGASHTVILAYRPETDPMHIDEDEPAGGWSLTIDDTTHHGPAALDALVRLLGGDDE